MIASRREFLATTLSGLGALLLGGGCGSDGGGFDPDFGRDDLPGTAVPLEDLLVGWFEGPERADIDAVGQAWINAIADEAALAGALEPVVEAVQAAEDAEAAGMIWDAAITADFDADDSIFVLHGWQLAATECALCGLMALFGPEAAESGDQPAA